MPSSRSVGLQKFRGRISIREGWIIQMATGMEMLLKSAGIDIEKITHDFEALKAGVLQTLEAINNHLAKIDAQQVQLIDLLKETNPVLLQDLQGLSVRMFNVENVQGVIQVTNEEICECLKRMEEAWQTNLRAQQPLPAQPSLPAQPPIAAQQPQSPQPQPQNQPQPLQQM